MRTKAVSFHHCYTTYKNKLLYTTRLLYVTRETVTRSTLLRDMFRQIDSTQRSDIYYVSRTTTVRSNTLAVLSLPLSRTDTHGEAILSPRTLASFPLHLRTQTLSIRVIALHIVS